MGWFSKEWINEELEQIKGEYNSVKVIISPFPCQRVKDGQKRRYIYPDFGTDMITDLGDVQLKDWDALRAELSASGKKSVSITLPEGNHRITLDIQSPDTEDKEQFFRDLTDAIIDAFTKNGIKP